MAPARPNLSTPDRNGGEPIPAGYVDVLRLTEPERRVVMDEFTAKGPGSEKRRSARVSCGLRVRALVDVTQFQGGQGRFVVYTLDISNTGIGFLHGGFLHQGASCVVKLRSEDGSPVAIEGKIVRCQLIKGRVHEVGVEFNSVIDVENLFPSLVHDKKPGAEPAEPIDPTRAKAIEALQAAISELRGKAETSAIAAKLLAVAADLKPAAPAADTPKAQSPPAKGHGPDAHKAA